MNYRDIFGEDVRYDEPMCKHTTFAVGGTADAYATPHTEQELFRLWSEAHIRHIPVTVLGNASNVLVRDKGIRGLVISLIKLDNIRICGTTVAAGAGALLSKIAKVAADASLTGLEFAAGIPGSMGGAAYMNAGAYDGQMSDIVKAVRILDADGLWHSLTGDELGYGYRGSSMQRCDSVITSVLLELNKGNSEFILSKMTCLQEQRRSKQPLEWPSAGSVFKRPDGFFAAALIEECGLKGLMTGGAQVSDKHSGFIINRGGAKAADVLALIEMIKKTVREKKNVELDMEIIVIGEK